MAWQYLAAGGLIVYLVIGTGLLHLMNKPPEPVVLIERIIFTMAWPLMMFVYAFALIDDESGI